jgi:hypothetical protein
MAAFAMPYFVPTPRQTNFLILLASAVVALAFYLRLSLVEAPLLVAACAGNASRVSCGIRQLLIELYEMQFFGGVALVTATLHFNRPRVGMFAIALVATCFGLFLFNAGSAALAAALLIIAFARPVRASKRQPARREPPRTTLPASSKPTH